MQGARKFARRKLFVAFSLALAWVGLGPYLLLRLTFTAPALVYAYFFLWVSGVFSDFYTTYRFYRLDPEGFEGNELSGYMRRLYRVFGFKAGLTAFLIFVELPIGLVVSFLLVPASAAAFNLPQPEALVCLSSGFAFLGIMHLAAAAWNLILEVRKPLP